MSNALARRDRVEIRGLCSFYVKQYKAYTERNPKTGGKVRIKPKKLPFFKCGDELKKELQAVNKEINALIKKTQSLLRAVGKLEKPKVAKKPKAKPATAKLRVLKIESHFLLISTDKGYAIELFFQSTKSLLKYLSPKGIDALKIISIYKYFIKTFAIIR